TGNVGQPENRRQGTGNRQPATGNRQCRNASAGRQLVERSARDRDRQQPAPALPVACCLLPVACCLLPVACCLLPVACCLLPVACCRLPVAGSPIRIVHAGAHAEVPGGSTIAIGVESGGGGPAVDLAAVAAEVLGQRAHAAAQLTLMLTRPENMPWARRALEGFFHSADPLAMLRLLLGLVLGCALLYGAYRGLRSEPGLPAAQEQAAKRAGVSVSNRPGTARTV